MRTPPAGWPHAAHSRHVAGVHRWHVQEMGTGPDLLLIHGAGGAAHSWRGMLPRLARTHRVLALDLPGQGFTTRGARGREGLDPVATDIAALAAAEGWAPAAVIGHSAGAAVALRLAGMVGASRVACVNAALGDFPGLAGLLFPAMAKLLAANPLTALTVSALATRGAAERIIRSTGSSIDDEGLDCYARLFGDRGHVDATLRMMARWSLTALRRDLPGIAIPVLLLTGDRDVAVPPEVSDEAAAMLPRAERLDLPGLGHLAHEEAPDRVADAISEFLGT